jgi:hypothetical protein
MLHMGYISFELLISLMDIDASDNKGGRIIILLYGYMMMV